MSATRLDTRFRNFVETAPDPVLLLDDEGRIVVANAATERLCNAEPGSLTGRHLEELPALRDPESAKRVFVLSSISDVAEQRGADARFRGLLESAPDGIVVVDANGVIVIVNSQTERMFGYTREELLGQPIEMLVPARFRPRHPHHRSPYPSDPPTRPLRSSL